MDKFEPIGEVRLSQLSGDEHDEFLDNWKFECDMVMGTRTGTGTNVLFQLGPQIHYFSFSVAIIGKHAHEVRCKSRAQGVCQLLRLNQALMTEKRCGPEPSF